MAGQCIGSHSRGLDDDYLADEVVLSKHLIHQRSHTMNVLITDLHEDGAGLGEQIACDGKAITQVGEVAVDAVAPGVPKRLHLLRLSGDVGGPAVLDVAAGGGPLEVAVELDAVGRVEVDALNLAL